MEKWVKSSQYKIFLDVLRESRHDARLNQADVAERLDETQSFISKCERGERRLDVIELRLFCQAMGISFVTFARRLDKAISQTQ